MLDFNCSKWIPLFLQLNVDFLSEKAVGTNLIICSQNILIHKSQFPAYVFMEYVEQKMFTFK